MPQKKYKKKMRIRVIIAVMCMSLRAVSSSNPALLSCCHARQRAFTL
jgi:hypothetical protein